MNVELIDRADDLRKFIEKFSALPFIGIDTEFEKLRTFYPILGAFQVMAGDTAYILDPKGCSLAPFWKALSAYGGTALFFAAEEDIQVIETSGGTLPASCVDLQAAYAWLGYGNSKGLADCVKTFTGVELLKDQTMSDWLRRPLTDDQIRYAAADVEYLEACWNSMRKILEEKGILEWFLEDCRLQFTPSGRDPVSSYEFELEAAHCLTARQQVFLRRLLEYRQNTAERLDIPFAWLMKTKAVLKIVQDGRMNMRRLVRAGMRERAAREYGSDVMRIEKEVSRIPDAQLPARQPSADEVQWKASLNAALGSAADEIVRKYGIGRQRVITKDMEHELVLRTAGLLPEDRTPLLLTGWRRQFFEPACNKVMERVQKGGTGA